MVQACATPSDSGGTSDGWLPTDVCGAAFAVRSILLLLLYAAGRFVFDFRWTRAMPTGMLTNCQPNMAPSL